MRSGGIATAHYLLGVRSISALSIQRNDAPSLLRRQANAGRNKSALSWDVHTPSSECKRWLEGGDPNRPRMSDLLQLLEHTPWLEELLLVNAGLEGHREPPELVARLRSLRTLTLHGTVVKAKLLQHLVLPASADINLMGRLNQRPDGPVEDFLPPCLNNLPVMSNFTSLSITSTSGSSCGVEFSGQGGKLNITVKNENHRGMLGHGQLTPSTANLCLQHLTPLVLDTVTHFTSSRLYNPSIWFIATSIVSAH